MKDTVKEGAALHASPPARAKSWHEARDFGIVALITLLLCGAWKYHVHQRDLAAAVWLRESVSIADPWQRFSKLRLEQRPSLDDDQIKYVEEQSTTALEAALAAHDEPAFNYIERWPGLHLELLDKYPRDALQRHKQLDALWIVWPNVREMSRADRIELVQMATRCHLQEAEEPVTGETVLSCLHYGASDLGSDKTLKRLLDSARLFRPLTANP